MPYGEATLFGAAAHLLEARMPYGAVTRFGEATLCGAVAARMLLMLSGAATHYGEAP
jgi:hypothetical protein